MAAKKSTKAAAEAVNEELNNVAEAAVNEEAKAEDLATAEESEAKPEEQAAVEEVEAKAEERVTSEEGGAENVAEPESAEEDQAEPATLTENGQHDDPGEPGEQLSGDELKKISEIFTNPEQRLNDLGLTEENKEEVVKEELQKVEEVEKELSKDIKKSEEAMTNRQKEFTKKIFRFGFDDFWNGVTETI